MNTQEKQQFEDMLGSEEAIEAAKKAALADIYKTVHASMQLGSMMSPLPVMSQAVSAAMEAMSSSLLMLYKCGAAYVMLQMDQQIKEAENKPTKGKEKPKAKKTVTKKPITKRVKKA